MRFIFAPILTTLAFAAACGTSVTHVETKSFSDALATSSVFENGDIETALTAYEDDAILATLSWRDLERVLIMRVGQTTREIPATDQELSPLPMDMHDAVYTAWNHYREDGQSTDAIRRGPGYDDVEGGPSGNGGAGGGSAGGGGGGSAGGGGGGGQSSIPCPATSILGRVFGCP